VIGEIIGTYEVDLTVNRRGLGLTIKGRYFPAAITAIPFKGALVPVTGKDLLRLPEGLRTQEVIRIFSQQEIRTAREPSKNEADEIYYRGEFWEVQNVSDWTDQGAFFDSLATKKSQSANVSTIYFGVGPSDVDTELEVLALTGRLTGNKRNAAITVTAGAALYIYYAVPSSFGACVFTVGDFPGGFSLVATEYVAGVLCDIYRSAQPNLGLTTVVIS
jgi:hypothetical protein